MGEIDTKPIESVQSAISFFGEQRKSSSPSNDKEERELASVRVQLEAKEAAHKQALVKLDHYQKAAQELSTLLKNSDRKKNFYINQSQEATAALHREAERLNEFSRQIAEKSARVDSLQREMERAKELVIMSEMAKEEAEAMRREQEDEAQVEIALLKFEVHKGRSRAAAAEAAEARAQGEKTALYNALQQMGLEAEETKAENRMLKEAAKSAVEEKEMVVVVRGEREELESVRRELEVAVAKIGELRARAEQAASRAEAAERELEEVKRKRREHKDKRKAALAALRVETVSREFQRKTSSVQEEDYNKIYQPLGKVLNMKF